jgi:DNA-binding CsgD family transcriptional regulator
MDKSPSTQKQLSAAQQYLREALLQQRAATEELQATNRELAAILQEFLSVRGELRAVVGNFVDGDGFTHDGDGNHFAHLAEVPRSDGAPEDPDIEQLQAEADRARHAAQHAMRESALLRQRSQKVRAALRDGNGENHKAAVTDHGGLSKRERQVLALIVAGKSSKQIAAELGITFKTAVTHRASLMAKLDVHEIASVVREAIRRGLA